MAAPELNYDCDGKGNVEELTDQTGSLSMTDFTETTKQHMIIQEIEIWRAENPKGELFKQWLEPLKGLGTRKNKDDAPISPAKCDTTSTAVNVGPQGDSKLVTHVMVGKLVKQKVDKEKRISEDITNRKKEIFEQIQNEFGIENPEKAFDAFRIWLKDLSKIESQKPDVSYSGSTWTVDQFLHYIDKDVSMMHVQTDPLDKIDSMLWNKIKADFERCGRLQTLQETNDSPILSQILLPLRQYKFREEAVRSFLDALLFPIFDALKIKVLVEETVKAHGLPSNRYDYLLVNKHDRIIGVVEAKDGGAMKPESVVQCILQLMALQPNSRSCDRLFGIVSDSKHYVIIFIEKDKIILDSHVFDGGFRCNIKTATTWEDLRCIADVIYSVCAQSQMHSPAVRQLPF